MEGDGNNLSAATSTGNRQAFAGGTSFSGIRGALRGWWPALKIVLGLAVVAVVGFHFTRDLLDRRLWERSFRSGWVFLAAALYLIGLFFSALTWRLLLIRAGHRPRVLPTARAYYIGHLGKYLPGKAWALFVRADLLRDQGIPTAVGVVAAFYEVFITMTGAAVTAILFFAAFGPSGTYRPNGHILRNLLMLRVPAELDIGRSTDILLALGLLVVVGTPVLPPVFHVLSRRLASAFSAVDSVPRFRWRDLFEGLLLTCTGWLFAGASLAAAVCAVVGPNAPWSVEIAGRTVAVMGVSYVAGFVVVFAPSGLGVREFFLALFLTPELHELGVPSEEARGLAILAALILRVAWTGAEIAAATALWWLPAGPSEAKPVS
jgi:uncharacterized membrane protein YbhN (UPF0104 family)